MPPLPASYSMYTGKRVPLVVTGLWAVTVKTMRKLRVTTLLAAVAALAASMVVPFAPSASAQEAGGYGGYWIGTAPGMANFIPDVSDPSDSWHAEANWIAFGVRDGHIEPTDPATPSWAPTGEPYGSADDASSSEFVMDGATLALVFCVEYGLEFPKDPNLAYQPAPWSQARTATSPQALARGIWISQNFADTGTPVAVGDPGVPNDVTARSVEFAAAQVAIWAVTNGLDISNMPSTANSGAGFEIYDTLAARANELILESTGRSVTDPYESYNEQDTSSLNITVTVDEEANTVSLAVKATGSNGAPLTSTPVRLAAGQYGSWDLTTDEAGVASPPSGPMPQLDVAVDVTASMTSYRTVPAGVLLDAGPTAQQVVTATEMAMPTAHSAAGTIPAQGEEVPTPPTTPPTTPPSTPPTNPPAPPANNPERLPFTGNFVSPTTLVVAAALAAGAVVLRRRLTK